MGRNMELWRIIGLYIVAFSLLTIASYTVLSYNMEVKYLYNPEYECEEEIREWMV